MRGRAFARRIDDLLLGVRLAVGGSRTPWGRLALTSVGIGLGVAVLLLAASVPSMLEERRTRQDSLVIVSGSQLDDPLMLVDWRNTRFRGDMVGGLVLQPVSPEAPLPDGLERFPGPGEIVVSPALGELLRSPEGRLLRPRFPEKVVGVIAKAGLESPEQLYFYAGSDELSSKPAGSVAGVDPDVPRPQISPRLDPQLWITLALGVTVLLVPIVVFVTSATRLAEAARERRLAALRLVGADARQVRRIASGESLVGAVAGAVLGWLLFLAGRRFVEHPPVVGFSAFVSDVAPAWPFAGVITVGVPVVAVATARIAMRRTVVEPLGVVRRTREGRRRIGWRLVPMVLGVLGLLAVGVAEGSPSQTETLFLTSVVLLLVGVPLVLPWVVERVVHLFTGRSLTGQLALRRLRVTSGTAARSVSAIAVVLTGVIALQTVLASAEAEYAARAQDRPDTTQTREDHLSVHGRPTERGPSVEQVTGELRKLAATRDVQGGVAFSLRGAGDNHHRALIADCESVRALLPVSQCRSGDVFSFGPGPYEPYSDPIRPGQRLTVGSDRGASSSGASWRVPERLVDVPRENGRPYERFDLVATPEAAPTVPVTGRSAYLTLRLWENASPDAIERVRNVAAVALENSAVTDSSTVTPDPAPRMFRLIRYGLLLGTLVAFVLIGCGLFVSAAEQVQERRRPMAVLSAVGTRRRTLALSALLQNGIPMLAAMAVAVVSGLGLGALVVVVTNFERFAVDPLGLLGLLAIAIAAVLVVTTMTLPALRRAMHPGGLHTE